MEGFVFRSGGPFPDVDVVLARDSNTARGAALGKRRAPLVCRMRVRFAPNAFRAERGGRKKADGRSGFAIY